MRYPAAVYLFALTGAGAAAAISLPLWRAWCHRTGLVDDPGHRKIHAEPVPLAGGLAVMTALLAVPLIAAALSALLNADVNLRQRQPDGTPVYWFQCAPLEPGTLRSLTGSLERSGQKLAALIAGAAGMLLLGLLDDKRELKPAAKFAGQSLVALLVAAAGIRITLFVPNLFFSYAISLLWILTVVNAFNFVDNMNGLCAGLGVVGAAHFFIIAAGTGQYLVAVIAAMLGGALLGFLPYNFPRARAFLGDSGSHLTGYLLAILAILPHFYTREHPRVPAVLSPLLILAVPLGDLVWVVIARWRAGRPFYVGDTNHLSHRLVQAGLRPGQAVCLIWLLAAALGALALIWN